jgi:hypothetical protein
MSERDVLIEAATSAWRPRTPDGTIRSHPAWHDLDAAGRSAVFEATAQLRVLEAALDPEGLSTTARAILARLQGPARRGSRP